MDFYKKLRKSGLKVTPQRLMILDIISKGGHIDIEEIYKRLREMIPTISIATVYKNIKVLEEKGIISEVNISSFKSLYEVNNKKHIHLVCNICKKIRDIFCDEELIKRNLKRSVNLDFETFDIILYEKCKNCSEKF